MGHRNVTSETTATGKIDGAFPLLPVVAKMERSKMSENKGRKIRRFVKSPKKAVIHIDGRHISSKDVVFEGDKYLPEVAAGRLVEIEPRYEISTEEPKQSIQGRKSDEGLYQAEADSHDGRASGASVVRNDTGDRAEGGEIDDSKSNNSQSQSQNGEGQGQGGGSRSKFVEDKKLAKHVESQPSARQETGKRGDRKGRRR